MDTPEEQQFAKLLGFFFFKSFGMLEFRIASTFNQRTRSIDKSPSTTAKTTINQIEMKGGGRLLVAYDNPPRW